MRSPRIHVVSILLLAAVVVLVASDETPRHEHGQLPSPPTNGETHPTPPDDKWHGHNNEQPPHHSGAPSEDHHGDDELHHGHYYWRHYHHDENSFKACHDDFQRFCGQLHFSELNVHHSACLWPHWHELSQGCRHEMKLHWAKHSVRGMISYLWEYYRAPIVVGIVFLSVVALMVSCCVLKCICRAASQSDKDLEAVLAEANAVELDDRKNMNTTLIKLYDGFYQDKVTKDAASMQPMPISIPMQMQQGYDGMYYAVPAYDPATFAMLYQPSAPLNPENAKESTQ